jgi:GntR family transcriptional repressor for pyruvate dehydrogenase complex
MAEKPAFDPVGRVPRLSDTVAERLLTAIQSGQLHEGDVLPSERELGTQFGVSRTVVREAIRTLATRGVLDVQSGRGVQVVRPGTSQATEAMSLLLNGTPEANFSKIHDVRTMIEIHVAAVAAEEATPVEITELGVLLDRAADAQDDVDLASRFDVDFHRGIALAAHNELYVVLLDSIGGVLLDVRRATLAIPHNPVRVLEEHRRILAGIEKHDPAQARRAMEEHLANAAKAWRTHRAPADPTASDSSTPDLSRPAEAALARQIQ